MGCGLKMPCWFLPIPTRWSSELRWQTLGLAGGIVLLLVATAFRMSKSTKSFVLFRLEKRFGRSANAMTKIVRKSLSDSRLSAGRKRRLEKLSRRPDEKIDTFDLPELTEKFWQNAVRNPFYRPVKQQLTLRLDADIIAWLRRQGRGYQTRANALLRDAMLGDLHPKRKKGRDRSHANTPRHAGMTQSSRAR